MGLMHKLHASQGEARMYVSSDDRLWLREYWNGNLRKAKEAAEARCHRVQAPRFRMLPEVIS